MSRLLSYYRSSQYRDVAKSVCKVRVVTYGPLRRKLMMASLVNCKKPRPDAYNRLYCFPGPETSSDVFAQWADQLSDDSEVTCFRLPGQEDRQDDACPATVEDMAREFANVIMSKDERQFGLLGHGLGAMVALETARLLMLSETFYLPEHIIISCEAPPYASNLQRPNVVAMTDDEYKAWEKDHFSKIQGSLGADAAPAVCSPHNSDTLRKVYELLYNYSYTIPEAGPEFYWPLTVVYGEADEYFDNAKYAEEWGKITDGPFEIESYGGGHFYMLDSDNSEKLFSGLKTKLDLLGEL